MPPFLGCQCWYSFNDKTPFPGAKNIQTCWVHADLFIFYKLWRNYPWLVWCSLFWQDIKLGWKPCCSRAVPQSYLREIVFQAIILNLAQIKLFSIPVIDCLLINFVNFTGCFLRILDAELLALKGTGSCGKWKSTQLCWDPAPPRLVHDGKTSSLPESL